MKKGTGYFFNFGFRKSCLSPFLSLLILCVLFLCSCSSTPKKYVYLFDTDTLERPYEELGPIEVCESISNLSGMGGFFAAVATLGARDDMIDSSKQKLKYQKKMYAKLRKEAAKKGADAVYRVEYEFEPAPMTPFPKKKGCALARGVMVKYK